MQNTLQKIRKAREFTKEIEGWTLRLRRPTDAEAKIFKGEKVSHIDIANQFVIGWEGVTEADLVNSGASDLVEFDSELWAEVVQDRPELWNGITDSVLESFLNYRKTREERRKNSPSG